MAMTAQTCFTDEITVDGFCGGGGWSTGFELAIGRPVDIGINHDAAAIALHKKNHPYTRQDIPSVFSDTGLEYPEIRKFAMRQENVVSVRPKMNFLEVLRHYGYPLISKAVSNAIVNAKRTPGGSRWKRMHGEYRRNDGGRSQFDYSKWLYSTYIVYRFSP